MLSRGGPEVRQCCGGGAGVRPRCIISCLAAWHGWWSAVCRKALTLQDFKVNRCFLLSASGTVRKSPRLCQSYQWDVTPSQLLDSKLCKMRNELNGKQMNLKWF